MQVVAVVEANSSTSLKAAWRFAAVLSVDTKRRKADCQKKAVTEHRFAHPHLGVGVT